MKLYYDFHLHSCLSPCGDNDMTPYNLVNMAKLLGLDIIALTDHNSTQNCRAAMTVGESIGLTVVPGMELCTSEEVHVVCLFDDVNNAEAFSNYVLSTVPPVKNRPEIFGDQLIMNGGDGIVGKQELLLTTASGISIENAVETVGQYGGVCYPAHIDRSSYSVISNLGMITDEMNFAAVEMTENADQDEYRAKYPIIKDMPVFVSSDAHYLENMREAKHTIDIAENSAKAVVEQIRSLYFKQTGRR
ncbi:MAG: PHP domain-containing protein [Clostridiaceae bacterium]|nr:PHP domain-containing protein [Clostridiaceae bacterium]MDY5889643.1 PHP domain-containing protein [Oscillospiraceae bacterium]